SCADDHLVSSARLVHFVMRYVARRPHPVLADAVGHLWSLSDAPAHARERIVPSGTVELVINVAENEFRIYDAQGRIQRFPGAMVSGCYHTAFDIDTRQHASIVGVHFVPGGAGALGIPAGELADRHVSLEDIWGADATALRERLVDATPDDRFTLLEQALIARGQRYREHRVVAVARTALDQPRADVGEIARMVQLSRRRLIELFSADVGITPKRYARI